MPIQKLADMGNDSLFDSMKHHSQMLKGGMTIDEFEQQYETTVEEVSSTGESRPLEQMLYDKGLSPEEAQYAISFRDDPSGQSTPREHVEWLITSPVDEIMNWLRPLL